MENKNERGARKQKYKKITTLKMSHGQSLQNPHHQLSLSFFKAEFLAITRDMCQFRHLSLHVRAGSRHNAVVLFFDVPFVVRSACAVFRVRRGVQLIWL